MARIRGRPVGIDRYGGAGALDRLRHHPAGNVAIVFTVFLALCVVVALLAPRTSGSAIGEHPDSDAGDPRPSASWRWASGC